MPVDEILYLLGTDLVWGDRGLSQEGIELGLYLNTVKLILHS